MKIDRITAREILDSRGKPTLEATVFLADGTEGTAAVPSGASTGTLEAFELRDGDQARFHGKGVLKAIENVGKKIAPALQSRSALNQAEIDQFLIKLDGTENKRRLGANAILGVSLAVARAAANFQKKALFEYIGELSGKNSDWVLPLPMFNIVNGGVHADSSLDFQEFMIAPVGAKSVREAVRMASEIYQSLKSALAKAGYSTSVGDEGGFAPKFSNNDEAPDLILGAIEGAGYGPGREVALALDPAASEFYENGQYVLKKSSGEKLSSEAMVGYWEKWIANYPILSLEDGLAENDWTGWEHLTRKLGRRVQLVGDDIFVTNPGIIQKAIGRGIGNASLIKLNQIGALTETLQAIAISKKNGYGTVISHRSGETWDDFMADLAVGTGSLQLKSGAPVRGERVAKYNRLMRIEEILGEKAGYAGGTPFANAGGGGR